MPGPSIRWRAPDVFLAFALAQKNILRGGTTAAADLVIAGGALWVGGMVSLRHAASSTAARLALIWLGLTALPWLPGIVLNLPSQARMMAFVLPPLFLASTLGWAAALEAAGSHRAFVGGLVVLALLTAALSNPLTYGAASSLPGLWRLQQARALLGVTGYEKQTYAVNELAALSRELYAGPGPTIVVWDNRQLRQEDLNVVRFFGPAYPRDADLAMHQEPANPGPCERKRFDPRIEPVVFCTEWRDTDMTSSDAGGVRLLRLQAAPVEQLRHGPKRFELTSGPG